MLGMDLHDVLADRDLSANRRARQVGVDVRRGY
jgi:hypothetical protein